MISWLWQFSPWYSVHAQINVHWYDYFITAVCQHRMGQYMKWQGNNVWENEVICKVKCKHITINIQTSCLEANQKGRKLKRGTFLRSDILVDGSSPPFLVRNFRGTFPWGFYFQDFDWRTWQTNPIFKEFYKKRGMNVNTTWRLYEKNICTHFHVYKSL